MLISSVSLYISILLDDSKIVGQLVLLVVPSRCNCTMDAEIPAIVHCFLGLRVDCENGSWVGCWRKTIVFTASINYATTIYAELPMRGGTMEGEDVEKKGDEIYHH